MEGQDLIAKNTKPRMLDGNACARGAPGKWAQVIAGIADFFEPIMAPIWTPFVDCQFHVIFMERTIHAQHD
ncbi:MULTISPECIES: hypothetical protein [Paraburkholderia]|uniref:Uncharacterized protein n=1 Tax=Paraburkholderia podalyriae TaxID=1938811 RepID=A0ABR7PZZ0_9BURK|nr:MULTISPECIES: hypothetical protein [Paraburkholderia]MBC8751856.1 hypothetical protein [Paraburkholderia podalyriae]MDH6152569.1 ABC-type cobalt transport system substrate-binding protein [Paraburkholderia sp. WSM4179]